MKKYLLLLLSVVLFAACSDDEPTVDPGSKSPFAQYDYSTYLDKGSKDIVKKFGEPDMNSDGLYLYMPETGNINMMMIGFNTETNTTYMITESFVEGAIKLSEVEEYLQQKYGEPIYDEDEETRFYVNSRDEEKVTVVVNAYETEDGSVCVIFMNPQNMPEEVATEAIEMDALQLVETYMGAEFSFGYEIFSCFQDMADGMYYAEVDDDLVSMIVITTENDVVTGIKLFYENAGTDQEVRDYYESHGFTTVDGGVDSDGCQSYIFNGPDYSIEYYDAIGYVILNK